MGKPDLNRMWETFIRIGLPKDISFQKSIPMIRSQIHPMICDLEKKKIISWYCFLRHDRRSGVPTTQDDDNIYFHIRVALRKGVKSKDFLESLPDYCEMTRKIDRKWVKRISVAKGMFFDTSLLEVEEIEEVWRILEEQSEWLINVLNTFKRGISIPPIYIGIFLHYYANMTGLVVS